MISQESVLTCVVGALIAHGGVEVCLILLTRDEPVLVVVVVVVYIVDTRCVHIAPSQCSGCVLYTCHQHVLLLSVSLCEATRLTDLCRTAAKTILTICRLFYQTYTTGITNTLYWYHCNGIYISSNSRGDDGIGNLQTGDII